MRSRLRKKKGKGRARSNSAAKRGVKVFNRAATDEGILRERKLSSRTKKKIKAKRARQTKALRKPIRLI